MAGVFVTDIVMLFDVAGFPVTHVALDVIWQVITLPFVNADVVYVFEFDPTGVAPLNHWYTGLAPPFVGVAVNVTDVPWHITLDGDAAMLTLAVTLAVTVGDITLDVAGLPVAHAEFDVSMHRTC